MSRYRIAPYGEDKWAVQYLGDGWYALPRDENVKEWQYVRNREAMFDGTQLFNTEAEAEKFAAAALKREAAEADKKAREEAWKTHKPPREITLPPEAA